LVKILNVRMSLNLKMEVRTQRSNENWLNSTWNRIYNMSRINQYLLWFANENCDFRLPEIQSIIQLYNISVKWIEGPNDSPFWVVELSYEDACTIASRSVLLRSVIKLWGFGKTTDELHDSIKNYPSELISSKLKSDLSFCVNVETFGKTFTMKEKVDKIELFNYLPAQD
ncbi:conserved hypothetical protein, partial [Pediculus humanus corporis]